MPTSRIARSETVDVSDFKRFARALRKAAPETATKMRKGLRTSAGVIAEGAKANASFSERIPASVKVRTSGVTVAVIAGGEKAPNAAPIENRGKGKVRHPVFGNPDVWTDKNSHDSWFTPAVRDGAIVFRTSMVDVLSDAVEDVAKMSRG